MKNWLNETLFKTSLVFETEIEAELSTIFHLKLHSPVLTSQLTLVIGLHTLQIHSLIKPSQQKNGLATLSSLSLLHQISDTTGSWNNIYSHAPSVIYKMLKEKDFKT